MRKLLLTFLTACIAVSLHAQERQVSGRVTSQDDGSAIPGVNVVLKGTANGVVTTSDGTYSLNVPSDGGTLVFTFIGLKSVEEVIGTRTSIDIVMETDATQLSEVVVTALGIERSKNELPFAAQEVRSDEITKTRQSNFVTGLQGKVAGLDVKNANTMGGSTNVVIRGYKSIRSSNQALFVIDGVPVTNANINTVQQQSGQAGVDYGNAAADINPDNIESVNVLKGAAASALYGSRAANGVIMITTKKGRKNSMNVTVNSGVTWGTIDKSTFPKFQKEYGAGYIQNFPNTFTGDDGTLSRVNFEDDASFGPRFEGQMVYQWDAVDPASPNYNRATPWLPMKNDPSAFYETSVNSNQSISVAGGGDKGVFNISYTRTDEKGVLPNSTLDKDMFSLTTGYDINAKLNIAAAANFSTIKGVGRYGTGYAGRNPNQAFRQWWANNVDVLEQKEAYFRNRQNITWNWNAARTGPIYMDNPYWSRYENFSNDTRNNYFGYAMLTYKITDWLNVMGRAALNGTTDMQEERVAVGSQAVANYTRFDRTFKEMNYDLILNFNKSLSTDFKLNGVLGTNMRRSELNSIRSTTNGGLAVPKFYSLSNTRNPMAPPVEQFERIGVDGIFGSATIGFKEMLFLDLAARQDKSSTLPEGNNTYFYPSAAGSFVLSKVIQTPWLSHAKLRANYAEVGNDATPLSVNDFYFKPTAIGSTPLFSLPGTKNNPELRPERTSNLEIGLDADFFDERVGFDFTWYQSSTFDQIVPVAVTGATGYSNIFVNAGEVQNKGIEVSAFVVPVKSNNFSWTMNVNFTRNRNEVVELYTDPSGNEVTNIQTTVLNLQGGVSLNAAKGEPYGVIRGTNFVYTDGQKTVNAQGYYSITPSSAEIIGDPNPDWLGSLNNTLKYKNIAFNFLIDMRQGGDIFSLDMWYGHGSGVYEETAGLNELGNPKRNTVANGGGVLNPGVTADGSPNIVRAENFNGSGSTAFGYVANGQAGFPRAAYVYDGSFVKLREVALTFSVPDAFLSKIRGLNGIDVSLIGRNLWIIHKNLPYSDPEESLSSGNANSGYQSGAYPAMKNYGFNVRFKF